MEEMRQSERIVRQCFQQMEPGEIVIEDFRYVLPPKPLVYGTIEGVMAHFKLIMEGIKVPAGEAYATPRPPTASSGSTSSPTAAAARTSSGCARRAGRCWPRSRT